MAGASNDSVAPAKYILTILCLFTRYVVATPIVTKSAKDVAEALFTNAFAVHGRPLSIRSDEGKEFINAGLLALYRRWDIEPITTGGWRAWANPIERYHRYLNAGMSLLSTKFGEDWPSYLPAVVFSYNASVSRSTGYSPYFLFYGRESTFLEETAMPHPHVDAAPANDIASIQARKSRAYAYAVTQQERVATLNRQRYEAGYRAVIYKANDHVLYWEPAQSKLIAPAKQVHNVWKSHWTGPHLVTNVTLGQYGERYTIMHVDRIATIANIKSDRLSPYQPWSDALPSTAPDLDTPSRSFKVGTWCQPGSLFIIPLAHPWPFGVGKVLTTTDNGAITFQWYNTTGQQANGSYLPSLWNGSVRYEAEEPANATHVPYTGDAAHEQCNLTQRDLLFHSFALTASGYLLPHLREACSLHPLIWWRMRIHMDSTPPKPPPATEQENAAATSATITAATAAATSAANSQIAKLIVTPQLPVSTEPPTISRKRQTSDNESNKRKRTKPDNDSDERTHRMRVDATEPKRRSSRATRPNNKRNNER
jgi:hypothetical protein